MTQQRGKSPRGIGDAVAEKIEEAFGKPPGWMDTMPIAVPEIEEPGAEVSMAVALTSIRDLASPRSQVTLDRMIAAAKAGELEDDDWALLDAIVERIRKR